MTATEPIRAALLRAIAARDPDAFDVALGSAYEVGLSPDLAGLLAEALLMPWHMRHEDVARALQELRDPVAIDALFECALSHPHPYLDYDEFFALARKCTWALADIGTPEAKERLQRLAACENPIIAAYAQKRLDHWDAELDRKGAR